MSSSQARRGTSADASGAPRTITSIPLTDARAGGASIGDLVRDASVQVSTLLRAEVELAKAELFGEIKKVVIGSIFFIIALVVLLFSSFFFFFFVAELLAEWLPRWASFGIVFLAMVLFAAAAAGIGVWRMVKVRAPRKTIDSIKQVPSVLPPVPGRGHGKHRADDHDTPAVSMGAGH